MDVLQDVKRAEAEATSVEKDYRRRADETLAAVEAEVAAERTRREKELERDVGEKSADIEREIDDERAKIKNGGQSERRNTEATAGANRDRAIALVLKQLDG